MTDIGKEIIEAPALVEGEILTDNAPENDKIYGIISECEDALETILEVAQRIDHGMTEVRPNAPNREIVRIADTTLQMLRAVCDAYYAALEKNSNSPLLENSINPDIEGKT